MSRRQDPKQKQNSFPMWMFIGAAGLIVAALAIWFTQNVETGAGKIGPRLAVNTERIDFGKQPFDKIVQAEFRLTNNGDRTLTLDANTPVRVVEGC